MISRKSLVFKFSLMVVCIVLCNTIVLSIIYLYYGKNYARKVYDDKVKIILKFLQSSTAYGLLIGDRKNLLLVAQTVCKDPDVAFLAIFNAEKKILLFEGQNYLPTNLPLKNRTLSKFKINGKEILTGCTRVTIPKMDNKEKELFQLKTETLGYVCLGINLSYFSTFIKNIRNKTIFVSLISTIIAILSTYIMGSLISQPLKKLTIAARNFSRGIFPEPIKVSSNDEIGELARAFNAMIGEILRSQNEIKSYTSKLEELVEKRTLALKRSLENLEKAYDELQKLHDLKAKFLQKASHELRTPLTVIKANLDFIFTYEVPDLDSEFLEILEAIKRNVHYMHRLVEDMLTIVRLQDGRLKIEKKPVKLKEIVTDCVNQLKPMANKKEIIIEIPENISAYLDYERFRDVITNLLTNALRFTKEGDKIIFKAEENKKTIKLYIIDTGEGIEDKHLPHIFEPFYQVSTKKGGTGLGLSIVKGIVQEHGGTIEVISQAGKGTKFIITLPKGARKND